jgi:hypothetical protein
VKAVLALKSEKLETFFRLHNGIDSVLFLIMLDSVLLASHVFLFKSFCFLHYLLTLYQKHSLKDIIVVYDKLGRM